MREQDYDNLQRLLDYHFKQDSPEQRRQTEQLLADDDQVGQLNASLERCLSPLQGWADEEPPVGLAQRTEEFIAQHQQAELMARASAAIAAESKDDGVPVKISENRFSWILGNIRDLIAVAASVVLVFMVAQPGINRARVVSQKMDCAANMRNIGQAFEQYAQDNQGYMPYVRRRPNDIWWHIGDPGQDRASNTRNVYLLVKQGYIPADRFFCPGGKRKNHVRFNFSPEKRKTMIDFPSRDHVNYSFRLILYKKKWGLLPEKDSVVMTDQNPLFAEFDSSKSSELDLVRNPLLKQVNSPNHRQTGQYVLCQDGRVIFRIDRFVGPLLDDIFTIKNKNQYRGNEHPGPDDIFSAP